MRSALFLFYLIISANLSFSQTTAFHSLFDNTEWRVDAYAWDNSPGCYEHYYFHYFVNGDTLVNSLTYKKLYRSQVLIIEDNNQPCNLWPYYSIEGYVSGLREDPVSNKVYRLLKDSTNEEVLYDYNLTEGDTIPNYQEYPVITVDSLDSVQINSIYHKRWNFHTSVLNYGYIIDGIGHINGLIEPYQTDYYPTNLVCVKNSGALIFDSGFDSFIGCNLINGIEETEFGSASISVNPNPFSENTTIRIQTEMNEVNLKIYNSQGKIILSKSIIANTDIPFERDQLSSGIYYFTLENVETNSILFSKTVVITD